MGEEKVTTLLLRREPFGGILFSPDDAVHVDLDHGAFTFIREHIENGRLAATQEELDVLDQVIAELDGSVRVADRTLRVVDYQRDVRAFPFQVLNAPTLVDFQITTECPLECPHCYASSSANGVSVDIADIERVFRDLRHNGVTQVAIGGGEPLVHPHFVEILELSSAYGLVPNLTTNGVHLGPIELDAIERYCGAAALSLEGVGDAFGRTRKTGFEFFRQRLGEMIDHGIATVLQVTLSQQSFSELDAIVDFCAGESRLYGVIFLAYKEVGRGRGFDRTLASLPAEHVHEKLRAAFLRLSQTTRVGYDCCLTPAMVGFASELGFSSDNQLEGCSGMRSSLGIGVNLDVVPCTFLPQTTVGSLRESSLFDIWRSEAANTFRERMAAHGERQGCRSCDSRASCLGGCPAFDLVRCTNHVAFEHLALSAGRL
ncbi:MAG: hypothetical protein A2289_20410 [Deltaproteobacteria bacterium RIFOXYA12_FULL_58_15]|nr:MAG: hypothetical protein A2289_20410 [Deltaproteobacteria bacterium RIFOXYA12_FULL_58_15]